MKHVKQSLLLLFSILVLISACNRNLIEISSTNFKEKVANPSSPLIFTFNKDVAPSEKIDEWVKTAYIKFEPEIEGKFKWESANTLIFSPENSLPTSTEFKAQISEKLKNANPDWTVSNTPFTFHTPYFDVVNAEIFWNQVPQSQYQVSAQMNILFNEAVAPNELKTKLHIFLEGNEIQSYSILNKGESKKIEITTSAISKNKERQKIEVKIDKGFQSILKKSELKEQKSYPFELSPISELEIIQIYGGIDGQTGWIEFQTNQKIDSEKAKKFITVSPEVEFTLDVNDNHCMLEGNFSPATFYTVTIAKGLPGMYGGYTNEDITQKISIANIEAVAGFEDGKGLYLMKNGNKEIALKMINTKSAEVFVYSIPRNNMTYFLKSNNRNNYYDNQEGSAGLSDLQIDEYGDEIYKETFLNEGRTNAVYTPTLNLNKVDKLSKKGLYAIKVNAGDDYYGGKSKILSLSDLAIISKDGVNTMHIFVNSIEKAVPISGVQVKIISDKHQVLGTGVTDNQGMASFQKDKFLLKHIPRFITVETENDLNYLDLGLSLIETSRFDVSGNPVNSKGINAFCYGPKKLYRPGETIIMACVVKDNKNNPITKRPFSIELKDPTGNIIQSWQKEAAGNGYLEVKYPTLSSNITGEYNFYIKDGDEEEITHYSTQVEEYAPDQMRAYFLKSDTLAKLGGFAKFSLKSEFLFGAVAAKRPYSVDVNFNEEQFISSKFNEYSFPNLNIEASNLNTIHLEGINDEKGVANFDVQVDKKMVSGGVINAQTSVKITDLTNRELERMAFFKVYPRNYFIGIKNSNNNYIPVNAPFEFNILAVNEYQTLYKSFQVEFKLYYKEYNSAWKRKPDGTEYYENNDKEILISKNEITLNGETKLPLSVDRSGEFILVINKKGEATSIRYEFSAYGQMNTVSTLPKLDRDGNIQITTDKKNYKSGDKIKIIFKTPFNGKALITFERDNVYESKYIVIEKNYGEINMTVPEHFSPNMFVSATLFRAHSFESNSPMTVAHGFQNILVEKKDSKIPLEIICEEKIKPGKGKIIGLKTLPGKEIYCTLSGVDEGVLQINDYQTPNPYDFFYSPKMLQVTSNDMYQFLLPELSKKSTGAGDMMSRIAEMEAKRVSPISSNRFKVFTYWSGLKKADKFGNIQFSIDIPYFAGTVRFMASAFGKDMAGMAEKKVTVAPDIIMVPALPRFLSCGDQVTVPVTLINTTKKSGMVSLSFLNSGGIKITSGMETQSISLAPNESKTVEYQVEAGNVPILSKITLSTKGMYSQSDEIELAIRPLSPYITEGNNGVIQGGGNKMITTPNGFLGGTSSTSSSSYITVAGFPAIQFGKQLNYLISYPYGCLEQTISKAFPLLYMPELVKASGIKGLATNNVNAYINDAIRKASETDNVSGFTPTWPGGNYFNIWNNIYAAHFLIEAQKAGYKIDKQTIKSKIDLMKRIVNSKTGNSLFNIHENQFSYNEVPSGLTDHIYAFYVICLSGEKYLSGANKFMELLPKLSQEQRYLMAGCFAQTGRYPLAEKIFNSPISTAPISNGGSIYGDYSSPLREAGLMFNIMLDNDPKNPNLNIISNYLSNQLNGTGFYSTQEIAWAMMGLGKYATMFNKDAGKGEILVNGIAKAQYSGDAISLNIQQGDKVMLKSMSKSPMYYFIGTSGVKTTVPMPVSNLINASRTYQTVSGNTINGAVKQGDEIVCKLSVSSGSMDLNELVLSDLIPAGCELVNPRLQPTIDRVLQQDDYDFSRKDYRDDRIVIYFSTKAGKASTFTYRLRVVNEGKFMVAPLSVEAMYNPQMRNIGQPYTLKIIKRGLLF